MRAQQGCIRQSIYILIHHTALAGDPGDGRNHATRKTSRDRSSGRVLARLESNAFFGGFAQTCTKYIYFLQPNW